MKEDCDMSGYFPPVPEFLADALIIAAILIALFGIARAVRSIIRNVRES